MRYHRLGVVVLCAIAVAGLTASAAFGSSQFGSRYLNGTCCTLYGGRANIDYVDLNPDTGTALAFARVEADNAASYLVQAGFIKTHNTSWANCPDVSDRHRAFEALTPSGTHCDIYSNAELTRGAVLWSSSGYEEWSAWLDGTRVFLGDVGFGAATGYLAGDEMNGNGGPMSAKYGDGSYPWQRAEGKDGCCYHTIDSSLTFHAPTDKWSIGPLPSPFVISGP